MNKLIFFVIFPNCIMVIMSVIHFVCSRFQEDSFVGYRTARSLKNQETWKKGNACFAKLCMISEIFLIPTTYICYKYYHSNMVILLILFIGIVLLNTIFTELYLRKIEKNL